MDGFQEKNYEINFYSDQRKQKLEILDQKINVLKKRKELGISNDDDDWHLN